ncbi:MAG: tetratricopeptide repeat protein [Rubrobacter sp.]
MSESLVRGVFKAAVGFVAATLILLASTLYLSKYYLQRQQQLAAENVEAALESTRLAARLSPLDSEPLVVESNLLSAQGDMAGALGALQEATRRDPANNVNYTTLGSFYLNQMDNPEAAVGAYREALERVPNATNVRGLLATALSRSGDLEGAKREYEKLAEVDRLPLQSRYSLGKIYARTGEPEKAIETLRDTRERAEERLGKAKEPQKAQKEAQREAFVQSVDLAIADAYVAREDYEGAITVLEQSQSPQAPAIIELLRTDPATYRQQVLESEI